MKLPLNNLSKSSYLWSRAFQSLLSDLKYICVQQNLLNPFLISETPPNILYTCNRISYSFRSASGSFHLMSPSSCFRRKSKPLIFSIAQTSLSSLTQGWIVLMNTTPPKPFFIHPYCPPLHLSQLWPNLLKQDTQVGKQHQNYTRLILKIPSLCSSLAFTSSLSNPSTSCASLRYKVKDGASRPAPTQEFRCIYTDIPLPRCIYTLPCNPTRSTMPKKKHTDIPHKTLTKKKNKTSYR